MFQTFEVNPKSLKHPFFILKVVQDPDPCVGNKAYSF
jgi:hypothetical protein